MKDEQTKVTSSHWGAFRITASNGRIVSTAPFVVVGEGGVARP
ncbi:uncharacterized protein METZ01_LOCUS356624 [marine metagenome]|uniref:Molybdopterin oxidoreductase N-terminal domain-containing protein n=1 Tax=marine metagenome TaxID=408172 RepID=A0A382S1T2_9ZZZZ